MARTQGNSLWLSPMELEKTFNELKHEIKFGMEYVAQPSKFVDHEAGRDFRRSQWN